MSKDVLSKMDHNKAEKEDMHYLIQPRGTGKSWVFRYLTPPGLVGVPKLWDGKPLRKEVRKGLGTRHLPTARKIRDIRRLEDSPSDGAAFSLASAVDWREAITAARQSAEDPPARRRRTGPQSKAGGSGDPWAFTRPAETVHSGGHRERLSPRPRSLAVCEGPPRWQPPRL